MSQSFQLGPNLDLSKIYQICHCSKTKTFAEVHDENLLHAMPLNAVFLLSEEFQCIISD